MLLAGMGQIFVERHPFGNEPWWSARANEHLRRLREGGIDGSYDPQNSHA
jgi:uncharacterized membrane protein